MANILDGEARARRVADDLLAARLIARCVYERIGQRWRDHPLMAEPARIIYGEDGQPTFTYARPWFAYSVGGEGRPVRLVETRAAGSLVVHKVYSPAGTLLRQETELRGDPARN